MRGSHHAVGTPVGDDERGSTTGSDAWIRGVLVDAVARACPGWLASERDDIVQNAMARLTTVLSNGVATSPRSYVNKAAYHAVVDEIRRQRRRREIVALDDVAVADAAARTEVASESTRIADAIRGCLGHAVASRRAAVLLYLEGRGPAEISTILAISRKQADNLVHRGLADLRACLRAKGVEP